MNNIKNIQPRLAIALLAAGEASRFGSPKQLACYKGGTFIERSITLLSSINCELIVITGAHHSVIHEHLCCSSQDHHVVFNHNWQQGISSSIKTAVNHCPDYCEGIMFIAVDQIHVTQKDVLSLINSWQKDTSIITCAEYKKQQGIPAIFPKQYFEKLLGLQGDKGAKNIIKSSITVNAISLPNAALDVDTVEQLTNQQLTATPY